MNVCYFGTYERDYPRNRIIIKGLQKTGIDVSEIHEPVLEKERHKTGDFISPVSLGKLGYRYLRAYLKFTPRVFRSNPDVFITGYMGQTDTILLKMLKTFSDVPIVFNPLISLYHTFTRARQLTEPKSLGGRLCYLLDYLSSRSSTKIILDTNTHSRYFADTFDLPPEQIETLYVGADDDVFTPSREFPDFKPFKVLFYGKFSGIHGLNSILKAVELLEEKEIEFTIVGSGQLDGMVEKRISGLKNITRTDWIPYRKLSGIIAGHHLCLGIFSGIRKARMVIPNKIFQSIACRRPVLTGNTEAVKEVFEAGENIFLCPPDDPEQLAGKILSLSENKDKLNTIAEEGYRLFERKFNLEATGKRVGKLLEDAGN